ncbi:inositol 1,4,5-trisphosphate receptor-interacting protein [Thalassophryne amazonica]|uniref:inositol 1,4,5-trisphosphate receptor-interacting protein n=1 Tax=Thalassophryne amazonica TaxID=390379 RepID=UPI0014723D22|nr:inositol 1,4,5-trisphosphate receptor-interacting protein [Thalassophryne amazonica]
MQDMVVRVLVVALGLLAHLKDDPTVEHLDDEILKVHERKLLTEAGKLKQEVPPTVTETTELKTVGQQHDVHKDSNLRGAKKENVPLIENHKVQSSRGKSQTADFRDKRGSQGQSASEAEESPKHNQMWCSAFTELDYLWYIWNLSIISVIYFFRKFSHSNNPSGATEVPLPNSTTLEQFHTHFIQVQKWRKEEFLEGIVSDLLESMRTICDGGLEIRDFHMVEGWNVFVPFTPVEPFRFDCLLQNQTDDLQTACQIKLVQNERRQNGCPCQRLGAAEDTVCLLRHENKDAPAHVADACNGLCVKNTAFLSRLQVTRWFQNILRQAWMQISHKYQFDIIIAPNANMPSKLVVRFTSSRKISFSLSPVVRFDTEGHLFATPSSETSSDMIWTLSAAIYEDCFFDLVSQGLPADSCHLQTLEVAQYLHQRQTVLSGWSPMRSSHFKAALMHLLLTTAPPQWRQDKMADRLRDLLAFMERSLRKKLLWNVLIGDPMSQKVIELPAAVTQAKPVNIFHPLVVDDCIHTIAERHFREILRNANMLINDYICHYNATLLE